MSLRERWREWRSARSESDAVRAEMQFHIEQEAARNVRFGMAPEVAHREAMRAFGGIDRFAEHARDERPGSALSDLAADVRYALRWLRRAPGFAVVAGLTIALGIGANTALFSVVNAVLLRPLPFPDPDRLVKVSLVAPDEPDMVWSYPKFEVLRDENRVFSQIAGYSDWTGNFAGRGEPERLQGERVTAGYFELLGAQPRLGRGFTEEEARDPGHANVVVLSDALWRRRFNADLAIIGQAVQLDGTPATVVGIMPAEFRGLSGSADVFVPMATVGRMLNGQWAHFMTVVARVDSSVTLERARADVVLLGKRIDELHRSPRDAGAWAAGITRLEELRVDPAIRRSVLVVFGAVAGVLLIACANVANLLLARAASRRREIAVRLSLGAGRGRLVRQLITEALVLALFGGASGVLIAGLGVRVLATAAARANSALGSLDGFTALSLGGIRLDLNVLLFALGASVFTGLLFGAVPALQASRADLTSDLKEGAAATLATGRKRGLSSRNVLVVAEIAVAFVLLVGCGLMLTSLARLLRIDAGLDRRNLLTAQVALPEATSADASLLFWQQLLTSAAALPAARNVAIADCPPLIGRCNVRPFWPDGATESAPVPVGVHFVSPGYFATLGVPLKRGRAFDERDRAGALNVVIINEAAAEKYFPGENPVGRRIAVAGGFAEGAEIVGVTANQRFQALEVPAEPDVYIPLNQVPQRSGYLFVRTDRDPGALTGAIRRAVRRIDPNLPVYDIQSMEQRVGAATARTRITGVLLTAFAVIALLLALVGIYGVIANAVTRRTREIGLRMALGAARADIARLILPQGAVLVGAGLALGLVGAWAATRVLSSLLYDVAPTDPVVFVSLSVATAVVALAASAPPALRATRVDPLISLKSE